VAAGDDEGAAESEGREEGVGAGDLLGGREALGVPELEAVVDPELVGEELPEAELVAEGELVAEELDEEDSVGRAERDPVAEAVGVGDPVAEAVGETVGDEVAETAHVVLAVSEHGAVCSEPRGQDEQAVQGAAPVWLNVEPCTHDKMHWLSAELHVAVAEHVHCARPVAVVELYSPA